MDYGPLKVPLFWCQWVKLIGGGVKIDQYGMTTVDLTQIGYTDNPFMLANNVTQVFYVPDMASIPKKRKDKSTKTSSSDQTKRHVVLPGKRRIVGVEGDTDEDEDYYKQRHVDVDISVLCDSEQPPYVRTDHNEGILVKTKYINVCT